MGDSGDYWKGSDEYRRRQRAKMVECICGKDGFPGTHCVRCDRLIPRLAEKGEGES